MLMAVAECIKYDRAGRPHLQPFRKSSDNRVEFRDQTAAALGSVGAIAEFEGKASYRTEIGARNLLK
jgi:hypothetical protein